MDALEDLFEPSPPGEGGGGEERMGLAWVNEGGVVRGQERALQFTG